MGNQLFIYMAGNIRKGKEDHDQEIWTDEDIQLLKANLQPYEVVFLNPASRSDDLSNQKSVFGRDIFQVLSSDLILVDARGKRGLGVGAEMMFAKTHSKYVVSWLPEDSHYHRKNLEFLGQSVKDWIHPFVFTLSDYYSASLTDIAHWIQEKVIKEKILPKGPESLIHSISSYLETQLEKDREMFEIVEQYPQLSEKLESFFEKNYLKPNLQP